MNDINECCCGGQLVQGPFYIAAARTFEEPRYYPPQMLVRIEHCLKCGTLRLPEEFRPFHGENMASQPKVKL